MIIPQTNNQIIPDELIPLVPKLEEPAEFPREALAWDLEDAAEAIENMTGAPFEIAAMSVYRTSKAGVSLSRNHC